MKNDLRHTRALWICLLTFYILFPKVASAKNYHFARVKIEAHLSPDGTMTVVEARTYQFKNSYRYAYRDFPKTGPVQFKNFRVAENGVPYELSGSEQPGAYQITETSDRVELRWYFRARNEARTFEISYQVSNVITRYEDAAVLYYQFISAEWNKPAHNVTVRLQPPMALARAHVNHWLHGPLQAQSRIDDDGSISAWCDWLPGRTYFEIRALYPTEIFTAIPLTQGLVRARILDEEAAWAEAANQQRELARQRQAEKQKRNDLARWFAILVSLTGLSAGWFLFNKYGRRPVLPTQLNLSADLPARIPPALVSYLLNNRQIYGSALVSTLMDLARRGILTLRQQEETRRGLLGGNRKIQHYSWILYRNNWQKASLTDFEDSLVRFLFDDLANGQDEMDVKAIQKQQSKFTKFFQHWQKQVKQVAEQQDWYDKVSMRGLYYSLALCGLLLALMTAGLVLLGPWSLAIGACAFVILILGFFIPHRTNAGEMQAQQWRAFKKYLKNYHFRTGSSLQPEQLNDYLIYGLMLGLGKKQFRSLAEMIPAEQYGNYFPWYIYHGSGTPVFDPGHFAATFSSMVTDTTAALSSAAGAGGGASAGGGGGASSGGGGAG